MFSVDMWDGKTVEVTGFDRTLKKDELELIYEDKDWSGEIIIMYLFSAQYLHILQDSKRYLTNPTVQVQPQLTSNSHSPNWKIEAQG